MWFCTLCGVSVVIKLYGFFAQIAVIRSLRFQRLQLKKDFDIIVKLEAWLDSRAFNMENPKLLLSYGNKDMVAEVFLMPFLLSRFIERKNYASAYVDFNSGCAYLCCL